MTRSTLQATRAAIYGALSTNLVYQVDTGSSYTTATLDPTHVVPRSVWLAGGDQAPDPLVCFSIADLGDVDGRPTAGERVMRLTVWCVSTDEDTTSFIYEAVRARLSYADQDAIDGTADLSRPAATYQLPAQFRSIVPQPSSPCDYDTATGKWYIRAVFRVNAI